MFYLKFNSKDIKYKNYYISNIDDIEKEIIFITQNKYSDFYLDKNKGSFYDYQHKKIIGFEFIKK